MSSSTAAVASGSSAEQGSSINSSWGLVGSRRATEQMFVAPQQQETSDYIEGRFG